MVRGPRVSLSVDKAAVDQLAREITSEMLLAGTRSIRDTTRVLEREFERLTAIAVPGDKAWRAWSSQVYPKGDVPAYDPVGEVFGKGGSRTQGMLSFWSSPGTVRPTRGQYLAIPLRAATQTYAGKTITPRRWENIYKTKLRPFKAKNGNLFLVAEGAVTGRGQYLAPAKGAAKRRGGQNVSKTKTVLVFALIPDLPHRNTVHLAGAFSLAERYLAQTLTRRIGRIGS
ncbi:MAG TPA: DUF6441 family protein [Novosphingobium sp.]|nr:DUF6441 family protein [Novosphingobium sp.]